MHSVLTLELPSCPPPRAMPEQLLLALFAQAEPRQPRRLALGGLRNRDRFLGLEGIENRMLFAERCHDLDHRAQVRRLGVTICERCDG